MVLVPYAREWSLSMVTEGGCNEYYLIDYTAILYTYMLTLTVDGFIYVANLYMVYK